MQKGKYAEALPILRPLVGNHPDQIDILFLVGFAAIEFSYFLKEDDENRIRLLDEAIQALRTILIERPRLVRVRLELARAFFLKGENDLSQDHFERVLAGNPPPAMKRSIQRYLNAIKEQRRWTGYFGFALAPDSNINSASRSDSLFSGRNVEEPESGLGVSIWGGGEYQHPITNNLKLRLGGNFSVQEYPVRAYDEYSLGALLGPRWAANKDLEFSLLGTLRRNWVAGESYSRDVGGRFEVGKRVNSHLATNAYASWKKRSYWRHKSLDGPISSLSLRFTWLPTPIIRTKTEIGEEWERPTILRFRNREKWLHAGVDFLLPYGFTLGASVERRWARYKGRPAFVNIGESRKDRAQAVRASIHNRRFTVFGFSPQLVLVRVTRKSNVQRYEYNRTRGEFRFVRQF